MSRTPADRRNRLVRIGCAALFLSLVWASWRPMLDSFRETVRLQPLSDHERRVRQLGAFYSSLTTLRTQVRPDEPLALITSTPNIDAALFANYYLYPQPTRTFVGREAYRNSASDPSRPRTLVEVGDLVQRTTYAELRDHELRQTRRLAGDLPLSEPRRQFTVPLAASIDGPQPDTYLLEGSLQNRGTEPAVITLRFWPSGRTSRLTIAPQTTTSWYDLVYQQFAVMEVGWLQIESSQPVAGTFAFVNRGRADVVPLPIDLHPGTPAVPPAGRDARLWLLNLTDQPADVTIGGATVSLKPHELVARPQPAGVPIAAAPGIYAFASARDATGATRFEWPR